MSAGYHTILLTGANGDIADALARILKSHYPETRLIGADSAGEWPGRALFAEMYVLPRASDPSYVAQLRRLIDAQHADLVIPTNEFELRRIAHEPVSDLPLLCNPPAVLERFLDKLETARWLQSIGLPTPATRPLKEAQVADLPVIVKPRWSSGSRGIAIIRDEAQLRALQRAEGVADRVAQKLLDGDEAEFTCALVRPGDKLLSLTMRRRLLGGLSAEIRVERHDAIDAMLDYIGQHVPDLVALNVQLRLTDEGPRIFEINPRFSSTAMMRHRLGFADLAWVCDARLGRAVPDHFIPPTGARVFRRFTELVVPAA